MGPLHTVGGGGGAPTSRNLAPALSEYLESNFMTIGEVWFFGFGELTHGERGARTYNGVWGLCPQRGPGAEPLVGGQGGEAPLKLKTFRVFEL